MFHLLNYLLLKFNPKTINLHLLIFYIAFIINLYFQGTQKTLINNHGNPKIILNLLLNL